MKIGIIGNGVVGSTVGRWFLRRGHEVASYDSDPSKSGSTFDEASSADWIFVCVNLLDNATSWPTRAGLKALVSQLVSPNPIVIKTTIFPGTTDYLIEETTRRVMYSPEFLTEKEPWEDFTNPSLQVVGARESDVEAASELIELLPSVYNSSRKTRCDLVSPRQAELLKHVLNCWLATKVSFFNQLYDALGEENDYYAVIEQLALDPRVGATHMDPFQDGYRGWGGKCFTKDVPAFYLLSEHLLTIVREAITYNRKLRA